MSGLAASLLIAAALRGAVTLSDRTEARIVGQGSGATPTVDVETAPSIDARLSGPTLRLEAAYAPSFVVRRLNLDPVGEVLHRGRLEIGWTQRRASLSLFGDGAYGVQDFASLTLAPTAPGDTPRVDALPGGGSLSYASIRAGLTARLIPARRWDAAISIAYLGSGGVDAASRRTMAFQQGPAAAASLGWTASRRDRIGAALGASRILVSTGADSALLEARGEWRRDLTLHTSSMLGAGASFLGYTARAGQATSQRALPVGEASLTFRLPRGRADADISARLGPTVDRLSGLVDERLAGTLRASLRPSRRLSLRSSVGASRSVLGADAPALSLLLGELGVGYRIADPIEIDAGTRGALQRYGDAAFTPLWVIFAGVSLTSPTLSF